MRARRRSSALYVMSVTEAHSGTGYSLHIGLIGAGMNIEAISGSATVAIACTFVFLLAAKSWQLLARSINAHPNFPDAIMREAAQRFRDELETLSRKQSTYLGAGLMFVFIFAVAHTFEGCGKLMGRQTGRSGRPSRGRRPCAR